MNAIPLDRRPVVRAFALAAVALCASAAIFAAGADAKAKIPTEIVIDGAGVADADVAAFGRVESKRRKCRSNRKLGFLVERSGAFVPADRTRSSANAGWLLLARLSDDFGPIRVRVERKRLRNGDVCKRAAKPVSIGM
ncbi:MAG TPA: hypothetical protein VK919_07895 [Solirubrobacterales bacterium]|nr:hypothetical protein [Solirubrobacterales bacterium]